MTLPRQLAPMLATIGPLPGPGPAWAYEIKWDGIRCLAFVADGDVRLQGRNLTDITARYPEVAALPAPLAGTEAVVDGEVVSLDADGRPSFERLQHRMHLVDPVALAQRLADTPVIYVVFDVLWLAGRPLDAAPYAERRELLEGLGLAGATHWQTGPVRYGDGSELVELTRSRGFEGVVAKRVDSHYYPGVRSREWIKTKHKRRQELVVGGWVGGEGGRLGRIGALQLGYHGDGGLRYAGRAGSGLTGAELDRLASLLAPLARPDSPFSDHPAEPGAHWVEPVLVAEVEFTEWTDAGTLRHPVYKGLRPDRNAADVRRQ